ncbi:MAG: dethiobiotin synthase [Planctomycetota bacterium]|jgi:dethiobiotin synthetase
MPGGFIHVVGTDTGVGKTAVASALARGLRERGVDVGVCKPFATGEDPSLFPSDAAQLARAAKVTDEQELIAPVRFRMPASPWAAAREEGVDPGTEKAETALAVLVRAHAVLLVEGIGGVEVPLADGSTYLDILSRHPGETLVVARSGLGTLNHTLLTLRALRDEGISPTGVILNQSRQTPHDPTVGSNPDAIETFGRISVLASLPHDSQGPGGLTLPGRIFEKLGFGPSGEERVDS